MTKFENRTTTAVAAVMNFDVMSFEMKEVEIPYTRTISKAIELVAAKLNVPTNNVTVKELVQTEFRAAQLDSAQLVNIAKEYGLENAPEKTEEGYTAIPYTAYEYYGTAFGYTIEENEPAAFALKVTQIEKRGKNDAKAMLIHAAESEYGINVFALDYKQRHEIKRYAVVNSEEYQKLRYQA